MKRRFFPALFLLCLPLASLAAEISVLSAGAVEPGIVAFAQRVKSELGHDLKIQFNTAPQIGRRLAAGESYDLLISPPAVIDQAIQEGKAVAAGRTLVGRVGVGIVVRTTAAAPRVDSVETLQKALQAANSVVYNSASTGLYLDRLFARWGILEALKPKSTRYPDGASVMEHVIRGQGAEIGFGAITEIGLYTAKGLKYLGPLPAEAQNYTTYDATMMRGAHHPEAVAEVLKLLASPSIRALFAAAGMD